VTDNNSWQPPASDPVPTPPQFGAQPAQPGTPPPPAQFGPPQPDQPAPPAVPQYGPPQPSFGPPQPQYGAPQFGAPQYGAPQYGAPQYGAPQYGAPQYAQQQYGAPAYGTAPGAAPYGATPYGTPTAGWTPPPKPGLIPLRPLSFGTILSAGFAVMRRNPRPTFGVALLLSLGSILLLTLALGGVAFWAFDRVSNSTIGEQDEIFAGAVGLGILAGFIPVILNVVATGIMQGIISLEVARGTLGEKLRFGSLWRLARGRLLPLIMWTIVQSAVLYGAIILIAVGATLVGVIIGDAGGIAAGIIIGVVGLLAIAVLAAWLTTKLSLVPAVLMLERRTLGSAIARSWSLTNGYFWKTFGIQLLVNVIFSVASQIISTPLSFISGIGGSLLNPNGEEAGSYGLLIVVTILSLLLSVIFSALTIVTLSAVSSLIYIDIRMRKEGLDIELTRFVEARQAGDTTVTNPYAAADVTTATAAPQAPSPAQPQAPGTTGSPWV